MSQKKFFRPERQREEKGGERFQEVLRRTIRAASYILFLILLSFAGHQLYARLLEDPFFEAKKVEIEGCRRIPEKTILSLAGIEGAPNLFTLSLKEVTGRVEAHPWVEIVRVRKIFPDRVRIQIEERRPMAILQLDEPYYIDSKGVIFSKVGDRDGYDFPFLTGLNRGAFDKDPAAAKHLINKALELLRIVDQKKIPPMEEISEVRMEKAFGIRCFTQAEGVEVRMGWDSFGEKLRRLSLVWSDLQKRGVAAESIDCSDLKRMVVKKISSQTKLERR
jgi:cell division protein FtsQ